MKEYSMLWQILIPDIPHRYTKTVRLLALLNTQMRPGVRVLLYRDNLNVSYRDKLQALMDAATADYVSYLSDDDSVHEAFIPRVCEALASEPDYVGFRVRYTEGGNLQLPVMHSLRCGGWYQGPSGFSRDFMYYNPIRRERVKDVPFRGHACDEEWAEDLRNLGEKWREEFNDEEMLLYQRDSSDNFHTPRNPVPEFLVFPLPEYSWLDLLETSCAC